MCISILYKVPRLSFKLVIYNPDNKVFTCVGRALMVPWVPVTMCLYIRVAFLLKLPLNFLNYALFISMGGK